VAHLAGTLILRMTAGTSAALARGELLIAATPPRSTCPWVTRSR
jgi:hypothetical protein